MIFQSILFPPGNETEKVVLQFEEPGFFVDLNLDQIINTIVSGKEEYNLKPLFYTSLTDVDAISYRQAVIQEIENTVLFEHLKSFAENMREIRKQLVQADKLYYKYQKERLFVGVVQFYCSSLHSFSDSLANIHLKSRGFVSFREYLTDYLRSADFRFLDTETNSIIQQLSTIKYCINLKDLQVQVSNCESETDYTSEIEASFEKFRQGDVKDYRLKFTEMLNMNGVETRILDGVAQLHPDIFSQLDAFCEKNRNFQDETITFFDREIQFYIAYIECITPLKAVGLRFCYPQISDTRKDIFGYECFDLNLARKLIKENSPVVTNDLYLRHKERVFIVSGPNQGGKTTFARTFGQLHYLGAIGCPVPGREVQLFLYDKLFTHFEKEENIQNLHSKLEDDLIRIHNMLEQATPDSIFVLNEILTSTTLQDSIFLSKKLLEKIIRLDLLCVWVTFIDELASFSEQTVSMVSTVVPENPAERTFKIVRKPADGLAYAISIAEKYQLTFDCLTKRIKG